MIVKKGLWKAAASTGCWIVTEGFNIGIMKLAGDAVRDYTDAYGGQKMIAIGVAPWSHVAKNDILENALRQGNTPAIYPTEEDLDETTQDKEKPKTNEQDLDTNHSYFMFPYGSSGEYTLTQELQFRTRLEQAISSWKTNDTNENNEGDIRIPICGLVVGGDIYTLRQVCNSILSNKCPIVACQGTSGSADVFAVGLTTYQNFIVDENPNDPDIVPLNVRLELILKDCLQKMNPDITDFSNDAKILTKIFSEHNFLVSVFDMEESLDLDGCMIASLLSSAGSQAITNLLNFEQLKITLTLNRADIAKEKIFLETKKWKTEDLSDYMFNALMSDKHDFVKLFLEQGFSLEEFLTINTLERLYSEQMKHVDSRVSMFQQLWNRYKRKVQKHDNSKQDNYSVDSIVKLKEVGKVIKVLVGDSYHPLYLSKEFQAICYKSFKDNSERYSTKTNGLADIQDSKVIKSDPRIRRTSSLDMINIQIHSHDSSSNNIYKRFTDMYDIDFEDPEIKTRAKIQKQREGLFRRKSSLDFIQYYDKIFLKGKPISATGSTTKNRKSKRNKDLDNQIDFDCFDDNKSKYINLERPARELMIWSLLIGKLKLAELFWTIEKEPIAGALLASIILNSLASTTDDYTDKADYEALAKHFEDQAYGVLNQCYMDDESRANMLVNKELQYYGNRSVVLLAADGNCLKLMGHPCCQDFLTNAWYGELSNKTSIIKLIVCVFMGMTVPFLIPRFIKYKSDELKHQEEGNFSMDKNAEDGVGIGNTDDIATDNPIEYYTIGPWDFSREEINLNVKKIKEFYFAPITRFSYNLISYSVFLVLFSEFLLYRFLVSFTIEEMIIVFWVGTLLIEEIKEQTMSGIRLSTYLSDGWNKIDMTAIGLFVAGFVLRMITYFDRQNDITSLNDEKFIILNDQRFVAGQILISFSLFFFFIRLIYFFSIHIALGPKLIMITRMISDDLIPFLIILSVFIVGYGVTSISISYPMALQFTDDWLNDNSIELNQTSPGDTILNGMFSAYFAMHGEFGLDGIRGSAPYCDLSQPNYVPTPISRILVPIFLGFYTLFTTMLMFNLLIAMFMSTYLYIEGFSEYYWNFQRYVMLSFFNYRSPIAPPFIIFWHFYELFYSIRKKLSKPGKVPLSIYQNPFCLDLSGNPKLKRELIKWEHMKAMDFIRNPNESKKGSKQNSGSDGRSKVFRGQGSSPPQNNIPEIQRVETKVDLSGITEEMGRQFEKRFKDVDAKFAKFLDLENQVTELSDVLSKFQENLSSIRKEQDGILSMIDRIPRCQCSQMVKIPKSNNNSQEEVTKLEKTVRSAIMSLKVQLEPMLNELLKSSIKEENKVDQELVFTVIDDIGDLNCDPISEPEVKDPNTGRIVERIVYNHRLWRHIPFNFEKYPGMRMKVPNNFVSWQIPYEDYGPFDASEEDLIYPNNSCHDDNDPTKYKSFFNKYDKDNKIKRQSMVGQYATDPLTFAPLNPMGRTGLCGRGLLAHWGPNHSIITLLTRWSRDERGIIIQRNGKSLLQYIVLERSKRLGLPWFLVDHTSSCDINECSIKCILSYVDRRLRTLYSTRKTECLMKILLAATCSQIFKGFLDDHLNADNAWIETVSINFHESDTLHFNDDLLKIFAEIKSSEAVKWIDMTHSSNLRTSHEIILKMVSQNMNSYF